MQETQIAAFAERMDRIQRGQGHMLGTTFTGPQDETNVNSSVKRIVPQARMQRTASMRAGFMSALMQLSCLAAALFAYNHYIGF